MSSTPAKHAAQGVGRVVLRTHPQDAAVLELVHLRLEVPHVRHPGIAEGYAPQGGAGGRPPQRPPEQEEDAEEEDVHERELEDGDEDEAEHDQQDPARRGEAPTAARPRPRRHPPPDAPWHDEPSRERYQFGERQYTVEDLGGHVWTFTESVADVAAAEWGGEPVGPP